ncbi:MAG: DUF2188 domain-containing protein [Myxacorys californica WJT36-NPBG1]|jgi:hypothetical protein|nr:DUF2188 domain-containing protein [Myxacorys californica WJT36-NPBG1]
MPKRNQFVVPHPEGWAVKKENSKRVTAIFETQGEAIGYERGLTIIQHCELVIYDRKGEVRKRCNYKDPRHEKAYRHANYLKALAALNRQRESSHLSENALDN